MTRLRAVNGRIIQEATMDGKSGKEIVGSDKRNVEAELNARIDKLEQRVANLENAPAKTDAQGKVLRTT